MRRRFKRILVLTGAGISAESGLGTFRDQDGLWTKYDPDDVATSQGFARNPDMVHDFYNARRKNVLAAAPNAAHRALAMLERDHPGRVLVVTQNVDDLHERAGSCNLLHLHGELLRGRCDNCAGTIGWRDDMNRASPCPACGVPGYLRPDVVWFGERPFHLDRIAVEIAACDLFLSIGTSGNVYPAAGFVADVRATGRAHTVELNLDPSDGHSLFAERHLGPASDIVPTYVRGLLAAG